MKTRHAIGSALLFCCVLLPFPLDASPVTLPHEVNVFNRFNYVTQAFEPFDEAFLLTLTFNNEVVTTWTDTGPQYGAGFGAPSFATTPVEAISPSLSASDIQSRVWEQRTLSGSVFALQAGARWQATEILSWDTQRQMGIQLAMWNPTAFTEDPASVDAQNRHLVDTSRPAISAG